MMGSYLMKDRMGVPVWGWGEGHRAKKTSEVIFIDTLSPIRFCLLQFLEPDHITAPVV